MKIELMRKRLLWEHLKYFCGIEFFLTAYELKYQNYIVLKEKLDLLCFEGSLKITLKIDSYT